MPSLLDGERLSFDRSIELSAQSLIAYGEPYDHWAIAYSGGKDSSATVTLICYLIDQGIVKAPKSLTVLYADTRQELPPLHQAAMAMLENLRNRGVRAEVVLPEMDHRYFVYMFGRGVPPPSNTFRWCTPKLKIMSMEKRLAELRDELGEKFLLLTGVRLGESHARDQRISVSCNQKSGECGQGWFQKTKSDAVADVLAPLVHWRVCHVWDWLVKADVELGFPTYDVAEVYGHTQVFQGDEPINARTGCFGCPLVQKDAALERVVSKPQWAYLKPLRRLRPLYAELKKPKYRLRKQGERKKNGDLAKKQGRLGPLHMEARIWGLQQVLLIEQEVNRLALEAGEVPISLIALDELERIYELIEANTWPQKWDGSEVRGDVLVPKVLGEGIIQPLIAGLAV